MSCFNFIIMKVNGTDVSNLAHEDAIQLFINAREPIIVEVRKRGFEDSNKLKCFNYDTHMSPTLAVISSSSSNADIAYEGVECCKTSTLKSNKNPTPTLSISCQTELSAFDSKLKDILLMRGDSDLNSGELLYQKDCQTPTNIDAFDNCLRTEYDLEEITLRKSKSSENLGFTIIYGTKELSDSESCSNDYLEEYEDAPGIRDGNEYILNDFPTRNCKVYVSDIVPNSLADRDGRLRRGDQILQLNGRNVNGIVDLNKHLAEHKQSITILVSRNIYTGDDDFLDSAVYCDDKESADGIHQSPICECEQDTFSSKSCISGSKQKSCSSTTMTNIYPVLPIAVENVSDIFNNASIKAQLESVNKEISLLNSQIATLKLQEIALGTQPKSKVSSTDLETRDRSTTASTSTDLSTNKLQALMHEAEIDHIYETIPEDSESEAHYCSPYEGMNGIRVEQWLKSIGSSEGKTKDNATKQRLQKCKLSLDDYDNNSSAYNTGGSCSSALLVLEQCDKSPDTHPVNSLCLKKQTMKCKNSSNPFSKYQYANRNATDLFTSAASLRRTPSRGDACVSFADRSCKHRQALIPSIGYPPATPHTADIDSDSHSTLIARSDSYKTCQYKAATIDCKDEELSEVVWKVRRRPDGSRYIVRRVIKKCTQADGGKDIETVTHNEYKSRIPKFKDSRQRYRNNQCTLSNEKSSSPQHWLV